MITRLNLDCIATVYPNEYQAFSEAYDKFSDKYCSTGDLGEHARWVADAVSDPIDFPDEEDTVLTNAVKELIKRFERDGIQVYPVVLDSETEFELFFGVNNVTRKLIDLMGNNVVTEEYEESGDIYVAW